MQLVKAVHRLLVEGGIITAMNVGWVSPVGATFLSQKDLFIDLFKKIFSLV
jgi:hypothetical protein